METKMTRKEIYKRLWEKYGKDEEATSLIKALGFSDKFYDMAYKMTDFPSVVKRIRLHDRLTQEEFAKIIGIDRTTLSRYEKGERSIPFEIIDKILDNFHLKMVVVPKEAKKEHDEIFVELAEKEREEVFQDALKWAKKNDKNGRKKVVK